MKTVTPITTNNSIGIKLSDAELREILVKDFIEYRQKILTRTDWTDTLSAKARLGDDLYNRWQEYRQTIRDIPLQEGYPFKIVWPVPPA